MDHPQKNRISNPQGPRGKAMRTIDARQLMQDDRQIILQLDDQQYRLRLTTAGKLILTK